MTVESFVRFTLDVVESFKFLQARLFAFRHREIAISRFTFDLRYTVSRWPLRLLVACLFRLLQSDCLSSQLVVFFVFLTGFAFVGFFFFAIAVSSPCES